MVSPNHLKTTLEAGGADELTKQIELSIVRKKMRLLLRLARDIIMINKNSGKHLIDTIISIVLIVIGPKITEMDMLNMRIADTIRIIMINRNSGKHLQGISLSIIK